MRASRCICHLRRFRFCFFRFDAFFDCDGFFSLSFASIAVYNSNVDSYEPRYSGGICGNRNSRRQHCSVVFGCHPQLSGGVLGFRVRLPSSAVRCRPWCRPSDCRLPSAAILVPIVVFGSLQCAWLSAWAVIFNVRFAATFVYFCDGLPQLSCRGGHVGWAVSVGCTSKSSSLLWQ